MWSWSSPSPHNKWHIEIKCDAWSSANFLQHCSEPKLRPVQCINLQHYYLLLKGIPITWWFGLFNVTEKISAIIQYVNFSFDEFCSLFFSAMREQFNKKLSRKNTLHVCPTSPQNSNAICFSASIYKEPTIYISYPVFHDMSTIAEFFMC